MKDLHAGQPQVDPLDFKTALDRDLRSKRINERILAAELGVTQQTISKWRHKGYAPRYRVQPLLDFLGPDSHLAQLNMHEVLGSRTNLRSEPPRNLKRPAAAGSKPRAQTISAGEEAGESAMPRRSVNHAGRSDGGGTFALLIQMPKRLEAALMARGGAKWAESRLEQLLLWESS
ncbi:hypothetical protein ACT80S_00140 [Ramlibacter sp. MAHUQ-53]|uniref:hypothetical protein n=1 Tax=unclassified Ramlibacter TaxID=2617605 RepID=UPI00363417BC